MAGKDARSDYEKYLGLSAVDAPKDRLLDFKLKDGWGPLCAFLGKDIPDAPFPRVNETGAFKEKQAIITKQAGKKILRNAVQYIGSAITALVGLMWYRRG